VADIGVTYTLDTTQPDIVFNQGVEPFDGTDKYYLTEIRGLDSPTLRTPMDPVPLGDGALIHPFWYGATQISFEGVIIVNSVSIMDDIVEVRNTMTAALKAALDSIKQVPGTLTFTPQGLGAQSISGLYYEVGLQTGRTDNNYTYTFSFGLVTGTPYS